jgi:hypothetical protein
MLCVLHAGRLMCAVRLHIYMSVEQVSGGVGIRRVTVTAIIALCVLFCAAVLYSLERQRSARTSAKLVSVAFVGFSTNDAGQRCLRYRLRNDNAQNILALAELQNGQSGSDLFVRLTNSQPQTIDLPSFPTVTPYRIRISCFVEDRGTLTHAYWAIQRLRGQPIHEISKLLFKVPGPVVEP